MRLWSTAYGFPMAALLLCGYLMYRCNLREECQEIQRINAAKQQRLMWEREKPSAALCHCFLENLAATAGRANPCLIAACLYLGGAGSLLWMVVVSPLCIFLRFVQLALLWPQEEKKEAGLCERARRRRKRKEIRELQAKGDGACGRKTPAEQESGLSGLIESELCTRMHVPSAVWLSRLMKLGSSAAVISFLPLYGAALWMRQYTGVPAAAVPAAVFFLLLFSALRSEKSRKTEEGVKQVAPGSAAQKGAAMPGRFGHSWEAGAICIYLMLLLVLFLPQLSRLNIVLSAVISDGFQQQSFMGSAVNRGWITCFAAGIGMACYISGLTEESSSRNYLRLLEMQSEEKRGRTERSGEAAQAEANTLLRLTSACAAEAAVGLWGIGLITGLCLVAAELSRTGNPLESAVGFAEAWKAQEAMPVWLSSGTLALFLLLSFCLSLYSWKRQLREAGRYKAAWILCSCAVGVLWGFLLPEGPLWAVVLLLFLWPQLCCRLIATICLSDRFRRLWMQQVSPLP